MSEEFVPSIRIHRVTTRRRSLRALQCPLEPELLIAEFASELPPDVAVAVREHIAVCEVCGARSQALRKPYDLLASLGHEPVSYIPDLRNTVRTRAGTHRLDRKLMAAAAAIGRGGFVAVASLIGVVALGAFIVLGVLFSAGARNISRSENHLTHVQDTNGRSIVFAQTDKLVTVTDDSGRQWQVAEVLVVNQHTGVVLHSLPASDDSLQASRPDELPVAVATSPDGNTIYELTAPNAQHEQVLAAFDATSGAVRFVTQLALPGGRKLIADATGDALALSPDGSLAYVGLNISQPAGGGVRALTVNARTGAIMYALTPGYNATISMPPPPGSLPVSAFPDVVPTLYASGLASSLGAHGGMVLSPDGKWLFDLITLKDATGKQYGVVRRFDAQTGQLGNELAIEGDFTIARLAMSVVSSGVDPTAGVAPYQLYLVKGSPDAQVFVLDPGDKGPTLLGDIALGGPAAPPNAAFYGVLTASPSADGTHLYVTQYAVAKHGLIEGHDLWMVDTMAMNVAYHRVSNDAADGVLANSVGAATFILRGGAILLIAPDLGGSPAQWLDLGDSHSVVALIGTR
jgi:hypothetical protein